MRTTVRRPALLAATAVAALSLTLTACGGDGAKTDGAGAPASSASASKSAGVGETAQSGAGGASAGAAGSAAPKPGSDTAGQQSGSKNQTGGNAPACTVDDVKISAAKQDGVPTTHITLTATNVSGRACTLLQYPLIAFGDIQTAKDVPPVAKSKPGTPVVLAAGAPAYAAVRINGGGVHEENRAVTSFNVNLFAAAGPAEGSKVVTAPTGGIAVNDAGAKTGYWTPQLRDGADEF
ncbi:DUF4232 domain-containing protein [Streptomyces sp. NPDC003042]